MPLHVELDRSGETKRLELAQGTVAAVGASPSGDTLVIASGLSATGFGADTPLDVLSLFDAATGNPIVADDLPRLGWYTYSVAVNDGASAVAAAVAVSDSSDVSSNVVRYFSLDDDTTRTVSYAPPLAVGEMALVDSIVFDGGNLIIAFPPENTCALASVAYETLIPLM